MSTRTKAIVRLSLLGAFVVCALAAQSASAAFTTSNRLTAYTCASGQTQDYSDAHCTQRVTPPSGAFGHLLITSGPTSIELTNAGTSNNTTASTSTVLNGEAFEVESEITATSLTGTGSIENLEPESTKHRIKYRTVTVAEGVTVNKPKNCKVKGGSFTITAMGTGVEEGAKMGLSVEPEAGKNLAEFEMENNGGACVLAGKKLILKGSAIATGGAGNEANGSGATLILEAGNGMESLTFAGNPATLTGKKTAKMVGGNPILFTRLT